MINHTDKQGVLMFIHVYKFFCIISSQKQQIYNGDGYFHHVNQINSSDKFINVYHFWMESRCTKSLKQGNKINGLHWIIK